MCYNYYVLTLLYGAASLYYYQVRGDVLQTCEVEVRADVPSLRSRSLGGWQGAPPAAPVSQACPT